MVPSPAMARPHCRKPTLADLMILVAATAAGLAGSLALNPGWIVVDWSSFEFQALKAMPLLTGWALALIAIRLRRPRPRTRRVFRQPGMVACCVVAFTVLLGIIQVSFMEILDKFRYLSFVNELFHGSFDLLEMFGYYTASSMGLFKCGFGIVASWIILALAGCWQPESGWIDRSGMLLGGCWIVIWCLVRFGL
jgi:hypothetical protein